MKLLKLIVLALVVTVPLFGDHPHLILHFDINKTLIATDKAGGRSVEDVLNEALAKTTTSKWTSSQAEPISFEDYIYTVVVPGPVDDPSIRKQRRYYLDHFVDYLRVHAHPLYDQVNRDYEKALATLEGSKGAVFPSFYRLIDELNRREIPYSIILRSFGHDINEVAYEIGQTYTDMFKHFGKFREGTLHLSGQQAEDAYDIYRLLRLVGHAAVHDDWNHWTTHGLDENYGKPFYIDREDLSTLSIFFDDNVHTDNTGKNILSARDAKTGKVIPISDLIESGHVLSVDTVEAILNTDYFLNHTLDAIQRHAAREKIENSFLEPLPS